MSFSNLEFLYNNLPARYRREDRDLLLKRFLQFFGDTLDEWDTTFDNFYQQINADTADEAWIDWWMLALFGWSWYPSWFSLSNKRRLFRNMARHNARRGTKNGIELWLKDFGIIAQVHIRPRTWGEFVWGEVGLAVTEPLYVVIEILSLQMMGENDCNFWGEFVWGESLYTDVLPRLSDREMLNLVRYMSPLSQEVYIVWRTHKTI